MSVSRYEQSESVSFVLNSKVYVVDEKYVKNLAAFNPLFDKSGRLEPDGSVVELIHPFDPALKPDDIAFIIEVVMDIITLNSMTTINRDDYPAYKKFGTLLTDIVGLYDRFGPPVDIMKSQLKTMIGNVLHTQIQGQQIARMIETNEYNKSERLCRDEDGFLDQVRWNRSDKCKNIWSFAGQHLLDVFCNRISHKDFVYVDTVKTIWEIISSNDFAYVKQYGGTIHFPNWWSRQDQVAKINNETFPPDVKDSILTFLKN